MLRVRVPSFPRKTEAEVPEVTRKRLKNCLAGSLIGAEMRTEPDTE